MLLPKGKSGKTTVLTTISQLHVLLKLKSHPKQNFSFCNNNLFTYYWANSESSIEGTAIMIRNHLKPHVHSCHTHSGGAIALDLFFKGNIKLRIISVYLLFTDSNKRNQTQNHFTVKVLM